MEALFLAYSRRLEETNCDYLRYLYSQIEWDERLIGIKGARGVGKTTMLLQHIKQTFPDTSKAFYVSLDHIWFSTHTLLELTEYLYTHGVNHLYLDEVHRYPNWITTVKNIYDSYPKLHIVFTGSSLLEIDNAEADLSRRLRTYHLEGLSFREYLTINHIANLETQTFEEILSHHQQIAASICSKLKILPHFERYVKQGFYPFFLETTSTASYYERIQYVVTTVIENDIPAVENIEYETLQKAKRLLVLLAQMKPFTPNISSLCDALGTTRNQLIRLLSLLHRAALVRLLYTERKDLKALGKPEKILFNNPNLMQALASPADIGTIRESLFAAMLSQSHTVHYPKQGDLLVDSKYIFEVGGKNKGFTQIKNIPESYVVADEIEIGFGNKIPLWLFGMLY
ncbi:MAG: AAA family ATPase [Prevotella sp.]|nr:AAA family ATPase [Prevotella sp.]